MRGKLRAQTLRAENVEAHQGVEGTVEDPGREHRCSRNRRFTISIRFPRVHGSDARLGPVPEKDKDERQSHGRLIKLRGVSYQRRPVQARQRIYAQHLMRGIVGENRPEQRQGKPHASDDRVFPGRFQRGIAPVEHNEEHRCQGCSLNRHPEHSQIVGQCDQNHGENKQWSESVVLSQFVDGEPAAHFLGLLENSAFFIVTKISDSIDRADECHKSTQQNRQAAESIGIEKPVPKRHRAAAKHARRQGYSKAELNAEGSEIDRFHPWPLAKEKRQRAGDQRNNKECEQNHRFAYSLNFRSLLTSMESNVSRIRNTRIPSTITATKTSKKMPSSTINGMP